MASEANRGLWAALSLALVLGVKFGDNLASSAARLFRPSDTVEVFERHADEFSRYGSREPGGTQGHWNYRGSGDGIRQRWNPWNRTINGGDYTGQSFDPTDRFAFERSSLAERALLEGRLKTIPFPGLVALEPPEWHNLPVRGPQLLVLLPDNGPTAAQQSQLAKLKVHVDRLENATQLYDAGIEETLRFLDSNANAQPLVVIAHSEERGQELILPNGTRLQREVLREECEARKILCVILTCYGEDLNIKSEISARHALFAWQMVQRRRNEVRNVGDFLLLLEFYRRSREAGDRIAITVVVGGTTATGIHWLAQDKRTTDREQPRGHNHTAYNPSAAPDANRALPGRRR